MTANTVLVALDGSGLADAALEPALALAGPEGRIHLMIVIADVARAAGIEEQMVEWGTGFLGERADRLREVSPVAVEQHVVLGRPSERILAEAEPLDADAVVMATHGRGAVGRVWMGSIADTVARRSDRPVLLVRPDPDADPPLRADAAFRRVLIPLDGSSFGERALTPVVDLLGGEDVTYHLLHVLDDAPLLAPAEAGIALPAGFFEERARAAETYLEGLVASLAEQGVRAQASVRRASDVPECLARAAGELDVDLVALASHGRGGLSRLLLGSVADRIVRATRLPVLVLHGEDEPEAGVTD